MERLRWTVLFVGAIMLGITVAMLVGLDRAPDLLVLGWMALMTFWFFLTDLKVDSYSA